MEALEDKGERKRERHNDDATSLLSPAPEQSQQMQQGSSPQHSVATVRGREGLEVAPGDDTAACLLYLLSEERVAGERAPLAEVPWRRPVVPKRASCFFVALSHATLNLQFEKVRTLRV